MENPLLLNETNDSNNKSLIDINKDSSNRLKKLIKLIDIKKYSYKNDAYENANCCSKLFFYWAYKTLKVKTF